MHVPVAPTGPQEAAAAGKEAQQAVHLDKRVLGFGQCQTAPAALDVDEIQALPRLRAIEHQGPDNPRIQPSEARNVDIRLGGKAQPLGVAGEIDDADAHARIRLTRFGIALAIDLDLRGIPIDDRILGHGALIHLEIGDMAGVRGPEVVAAHVQFFAVNPVDLAVPDGRTRRWSA